MSIPSDNKDAASATPAPPLPSASVERPPLSMAQSSSTEPSPHELPHEPPHEPPRPAPSASTHPCSGAPPSVSTEPTRSGAPPFAFPATIDPPSTNQPARPSGPPDLPSTPPPSPIDMGQFRDDEPVVPEFQGRIQNSVETEPTPGKLPVQIENDKGQALTPLCSAFTNKT